MTPGEVRSRWKIHADRIVDQNPYIRLSVATLELPDGTVDPGEDIGAQHALSACAQRPGPSGS